tara:strand:+ start:1003 stop:1833 length:831 start_codon:yes stop_codon:yes gene_type:complete
MIFVVTEGFKVKQYTKLDSTIPFNNHLYDTPNTILQDRVWKYPDPNNNLHDNKEIETNKKYSITLDEIKKYLINTDNKPIADEYDVKNCIGVWDKWGPCNKECGGGKQYKYFKILSPAGPRGRKCEYKEGDVIEKKCNTLPCPIHCKGSWSEWSDCDKDCYTGQGDYGKTTRTFTIETEAKDGYLYDEFKKAIKCDYKDNDIQTKECNTEYCAIDCKGSYSGFKGDCSERCGGGIRENIFNIEKHPVNGWFRGKRVDGKPCPINKIQGCNFEKCFE